MRNILFIFVLFLLSSCFAKKVSQKEYITVKDTVIVPPIVRLDTTVLFNDRFIYLKDSTGQMTVTIEKIKNNYIKVKGECKPKEIIVPVSKTVYKSKQVTIQNRFYQYLSALLFIMLMFAAFYIYMVKQF